MSPPDPKARPARVAPPQVHSAPEWWSAVREAASEQVAVPSPTSVPSSQASASRFELRQRQRAPRQRSRARELERDGSSYAVLLELSSMAYDPRAAESRHSRAPRSPPRPEYPRPPSCRRYSAKRRESHSATKTNRRAVASGSDPTPSIRRACDRRCAHEIAQLRCSHRNIEL